MKAVIRGSKGLSRFCNKAVDAGLFKDGKPYTITLTRFYRPKTLEQNAKFHAMLHDIATHIGYSNSEVKDYIKAEFGPTDTIKIGDNVKSIPKSVSKWTVQEMSEAIEQVYRIGAEAGVEWSEHEAP